jgi:hypothetical protein
MDRIKKFGEDLKDAKYAKKKAEDYRRESEHNNLKTSFTECNILINLIRRKF